jgi:hypothetical protein
MKSAWRRRRSCKANDDDDEPIHTPNVGVIQQLDDRGRKLKPAYPIGFVINADMAERWRAADRARSRRKRKSKGR